VFLHRSWRGRCVWLELELGGSLVVELPDGEGTVKRDKGWGVFGYTLKYHRNSLFLNDEARRKRLETMEQRHLGKSDISVSVVGLGTWVMGGWMWGGAEDESSKKAIFKAIDLGITLIDTAPVYGFGHAETLVGQALAEAKARNRVVVASKCGLEWDENERIRRNSSSKRIFEEIDQSLRRLRSDCIDLYQIHWPDLSTPFEESLDALLKLKKAGKIREIGVSNFDAGQMEAFDRDGTLASNQVPYSLFEREIEAETLPYAREHKIGILAYGPLCRGLLTGKFSQETTFPSDDLRSADPKFQGNAFLEHLKAVEGLKGLAKEIGVDIGSFAVRWAIEQCGVTSALCGARNPKQIEASSKAASFKIPGDMLGRIEEALRLSISKPISPAFMAPPL
jgi:aryl-alcohol dehydrogenase-like predicted oxidoreductase